MGLQAFVSFQICYRLWVSSFRKLIFKVLQDLPGLNVAPIVTIYVTTFSFQGEGWEDQVKGHHGVKALKRSLYIGLSVSCLKT